MKCEVIIDPQGEEKVVIFAKKENELTQEIKRLTMQSFTEILGYRDSEVIKLDIRDIYYITVISGRVYAVCESEKYLLKERLYSIEEKLPKNFVKINQSCLANLNKTERFDTSISGTMKIIFKNKDSDYVSRRQLKAVKERVGI